MASSPKLKPCPFCGCRPRVSPPGWGVYGYYVMCEASRCRVNPMTVSFRTRAEAVAAWNRRAGNRKETK